MQRLLHLAILNRFHHFSWFLLVPYTLPFFLSMLRLLYLAIIHRFYFQVIYFFLLQIVSPAYNNPPSRSSSKQFLSSLTLILPPASHNPLPLSFSSYSSQSFSSSSYSYICLLPPRQQGKVNGQVLRLRGKRSSLAVTAKWRASWTTN